MDFELKKIVDYEKQIIDGVETIKRLSPKEEQGRLLGGEKNVRATLYFEASERTGKENKKTLARIKDELKQLSLDYDTSGLNSKNYLSEGCEAKVYMADNNVNVLKVNNLYYNKSVLDFLDRISLHNALFPETWYSLLGFDVSGNKLKVVVKQPFIKLTANDVSDIVFETLIARGFEYLPPTKYIKSCFLTDEYLLKDTHKGNVIEGINGDLFFIDPIIELNTKDKGLGGIRN